MTPAQARLGALAALILGVLGIWISKRPTTDIAAAVISACAFIYFGASSVSATHKKGARARRERADRETKWTMYSTPQHGGKWVVGIRRRTEDGRVLDTEDVKTDLDENDTFGIIGAEGEAELKAVRWNDAKVRM